MTKKEHTPIWIHMFFIAYSLATILPLMVVLSASLSSDLDLANFGFSIFPAEFSLDAYKFILKNPDLLINSYFVTIITTVVGTFFSVLFMAMFGYSLSRKKFIYKKLMTIYILIPMLFSGGLVSSYIINTQYFKLSDTLFALMLPSLINVFHIILLRTFFAQLPEEIFESAKIDGAGEYRIFFTIVLAISKPVLATVAFLGALGRWNEWFLGLLYINDKDLIPLQYMLQRMMREIQFLLVEMRDVPDSWMLARDLPTENLRMAMLIVTIGPMLFIFPFFQKYFTKGLTVGSLKG